MAVLHKMSSKIIFGLMAGIIGLCASPAVTRAQEKLPELPAPLENMVAEGAQIRYLGRELGLDGWVTLQNGEEQYFYVTQDRQAVLLGILFNNKGDAITLEQVNRLRQKEGPAIDRLAGTVPLKERETVSEPKLDISRMDLSNPEAVTKAAAKNKSEQLMASVENANWVEIGQDSAPPVYMFMDPECPHCHDLINDFRKSDYLEKGMVKLRLIPVGVLGEQSLKEAAYLLASPTPEKDLFDHLDGKADALLANGNANTQGIQRNMQIMQDWKLDATPFSVYKDRAGGVKVLEGRPADIKKLVIELR